MGKYMIKTPFTALIFAALSSFFAAFILNACSQEYSGAFAGFNMPYMGYVFMIIYGFWLSAAIAIVFDGAKTKGIKLVFTVSILLFGSQWLVPAFEAFYFGDPAGKMTRSDLLLQSACGCASGFCLLLLAFMLFKAPVPAKPNTPKSPQDKFHIKKMDLIIKLLVLPVIYIIVYFLSRHFFLFNSQEARLYYTGSPDRRWFIEEMINMLLTDAAQVPVALLKGFAYALILLPLLISLASKRGIFICAAIMMFMGSAISMLIPSPIMPDTVRMARLLEMSVTAVIFGAIASFMLHTSLHKTPSKTPPPSSEEAKPPAKSQAKSPIKPAVSEQAFAGL